ncbi:MAG: endonuclease III domain-containing protein [Candidatus Micrarchaeota archaeon]|nr:endonuclease III domain-containing protein [Candidatus Micrarchaeota archaeon]
MPPAPMSPKKLYATLLSSFGPQHWWPAETRFEVVIGAILAQQTAWKNVENAIARLKQKNLADNPETLAAAPLNTIRSCVKCTGFYRQKAARLEKTAAYFAENYPTLDEFFEKPLAAAREELLSLDGVGPETADSILLYAGGKPVFVIDAYTRRIMDRALEKRFTGYEEARVFLEKSVPCNAGVFGEFHALLVELGKRHCRTRPVCGGCPVEKACLHSRRNQRLASGAGAPRQ